MSQISLILVQVKDDDIERASGLISQLVDSITAANGTVFHIVSSIVIATFDFGAEVPPNAEKRCDVTANTLQQALGINGKILFGNCEAKYGNFGSPTRIQFGPFIPRLSDLLSQLGNLDFGAIQRIDASSRKV